MKEFYKNKKVLITGHTGFKGAWLSQILINWGAEVVGISLEPNTTPSLFTVLEIEKKIKNYFTDVRNLEEVNKIFQKEKPEIVFHLAAQPIVRVSYDEPIKTISTNVLGTANILQAVKEVGCVKSVVVITTDKVYEDKDWIYPYRENDALGGYDPYSASKAAADIIVQCYVKSFFNPKDFKSKHNTLVAIARAGNVIGGGDWAPHRLVPDIIRSIYEKKEPVEIRSPQAIRPWEHVLEPLSGYLKLGEKLYKEDVSLCQAWNFGPNDESFMCVEDLANRAVEILGKGAVLVKPDGSKHETNILKLDVTKAKTILGWHPTLNFEQNLGYTFSWYKNYYEKTENVVDFTNKQINQFFK